MIPIVSIVGRSDSGKTTLIEKLIPELVKRGYSAKQIRKIWGGNLMRVMQEVADKAQI